MQKIENTIKVAVATLAFGGFWVFIGICLDAIALPW